MCKKGLDNPSLFMCIEIPTAAETSELGGAGVDFPSSQDFPPSAWSRHRDVKESMSTFLLPDLWD